MSTKIRFVDAGTVSGLKSQSIYHGLGYAQTPTTPDTIVLATPGTPYMCIGFFQDVEYELDINYCRAKQLPVIRRETGGGAVYIDEGQLFVQWIFQHSSLPKRVNHRFQLFVKPLIETYKFFGINAYYHGVNDVHVDGKKIVGTGAATIGAAEVVTGNFLFNFNYNTMIDAINVPSDAFKEAVRRNLFHYLTTMNIELDKLPPRNEVISVYRDKCQEELGLSVELGTFTDEEIFEMEKIEQKFVKDDWIFQTKRTKPKDKIFKIHLGVWIGQVTQSFNEGTITVLITMRDDFIKEAKLTFNSKEPINYLIDDLEKGLIGTLMDFDSIEIRINRITDNQFTKEWTSAIYKVKELQLQQTGHGALARRN
ncbi:MAG: lipoate--protein ligase [Cyclobacteriaceae bacterium]|nr:lipoate--protein ligase [Cyclobacteriaceae bacterium]